MRLPTRSEALALMITCEGNQGRRFGRMMEHGCASRWRVANGKQDGPSDVQQSACKGCPHGEARAANVKGPTLVDADMPPPTKRIAPKAIKMPVPSFVRDAMEARGELGPLPPAPSGDRFVQAPPAGTLLTCDKCLKEFTRNKQGPPRKFCPECSPAWVPKPLPEEAVCANERCAKRFAPDRHNQTFCTVQCQKAAENRVRDEREKIRDAEEARRRSVEVEQGESAAAHEMAEDLVLEQKQCGNPKCARLFDLTYPTRRYCSERCAKVAEKERRRKRDQDAATSSDAAAPLEPEPADEERDAEAGADDDGAVQLEPPPAQVEGRMFKQKECAYAGCGKTFTPTSARQIFHKPECKEAAKHGADDSPPAAVSRRAPKPPPVGVQPSAPSAPRNAPRFMVRVGNVDVHCDAVEDVELLVARLTRN